jgi:HPt (histidine-containing phosphotransfer) domain-containing protein
VFDRDAFRELVREIGEEAASEIHAVFTAETEGRLKLLRGPGIETEQARIGRETHSLKRSAGTFGYRALAGLALRLEREAARLPESEIMRFSIRWMRHIHPPRRRNKYGRTNTARYFHTRIILRADNCASEGG